MSRSEQESSKAPHVNWFTRAYRVASDVNRPLLRRVGPALFVTSALAVAIGGVAAAGWQGVHIINEHSKLVWQFLPEYITAGGVGVLSGLVTTGVVSYAAPQGQQDARNYFGETSTVLRTFKARCAMVTGGLVLAGLGLSAVKAPVLPYLLGYGAAATAGLTVGTGLIGWFAGTGLTKEERAYKSPITQ